MKKVTKKDYQSFIQIYKGLPERSSVKAPKTEFVEEIERLNRLIGRLQNEIDELKKGSVQAESPVECANAV